MIDKKGVLKILKSYLNNLLKEPTEKKYVRNEKRFFVKKSEEEKIDFL
jgi:hypothetical protein